MHLLNTQVFFVVFLFVFKQRIFLTFEFKWKGWTLWGTQGRLVESWTQTRRCFWPWGPLPKTTVGPCQPAPSNVERPQRHIGVKRGTAGSRWGAWWRAEASNHLTPQPLCRMWTGWQSLSGDKDCCRKPLSFHRFTYGNLVTTPIFVWIDLVVQRRSFSHFSYRGTKWRVSLCF